LKLQVEFPFPLYLYLFGLEFPVDVAPRLLHLLGFIHTIHPFSLFRGQLLLDLSELLPCFLGLFPPDHKLALLVPPELALLRHLPLQLPNLPLPLVHALQLLPQMPLLSRQVCPQLLNVTPTLSQVSRVLSLRVQALNLEILLFRQRLTLQEVDLSLQRLQLLLGYLPLMVEGLVHLVDLSLVRMGLISSDLQLIY